MTTYRLTRRGRRVRDAAVILAACLFLLGPAALAGAWLLGGGPR